MRDGVSSGLLAFRWTCESCETPPNQPTPTAQTKRDNIWLDDMLKTEERKRAGNPARMELIRRKATASGKPVVGPIRFRARVSYETQPWGMPCVLHCNPLTGAGGRATSGQKTKVLMGGNDEEPGRHISLKDRRRQAATPSTDLRRIPSGSQ